MRTGCYGSGSIWHESLGHIRHLSMTLRGASPVGRGRIWSGKTCQRRTWRLDDGRCRSYVRGKRRAVSEPGICGPQMAAGADHARKGHTMPDETGVRFGGEPSQGGG
jgi:hypothetical protein